MLVPFLSFDEDGATKLLGCRVVAVRGEELDAERDTAVDAPTFGVVLGALRDDLLLASRRAVN